jgi:MscS family membrane protein
VVTLGPEDEFDRGVPRSSVKRFLEAAKGGDFESAAEHLDLRNLPRDMKGMKGEEIGLRATRVRTHDNTVVSVPNNEFSKLHLENYALREKVWFHPKISLSYETTREQINPIADNIKEMLQNHPEVHDEPIQVYFTEIGDYSHNIDVFSYVATGDYGKYKKIAEELNFAIMDIVENAGARLALPSRKMYVEDEKGAEYKIRD